MCVLNWLDAKKRAGLIGPDANKKKTGTAKHRLAGGGGGGGGGDNICGRGTISASGLCPWGTISASRLCSGGQNLPGDRICSDTGLNNWFKDGRRCNMRCYRLFFIFF